MVLLESIFTYKWIILQHCHINNMGGKIKKLDKLSREIWSWSCERKIWLSASHIPGIENTEADHASRNFDDRSEWSVHPTVFRKIIETLGPVDIDLFASRLNTKCVRFPSWHRDPDAEFIDAFSRSWSNDVVYLFPPFSLVARCLQKIWKDNATAVMIVPHWTTQPWFTMFLSMLMLPPIIIPSADNLLTIKGTNKRHPLRIKLRLIATKLSGNCL